MGPQGLTDTLRQVRFAGLAPTRAEYESHLRAEGFIGSSENLLDRPDIALAIYRDWQRRDRVACVFARLIALNSERYDIAWEVLPTRVDPSNVESAASKVTSVVEPAKGQEEAVTVLLPGLEDPESLVSLCKALGQCPSWKVSALFNPSDRLGRVYVRLTTRLAPNVDSEVLGVAPFEFLPPTRVAPITALHIRTKTEGAKPRGYKSSDKSHLADIAWPDDQFWEASCKQRADVLGGDDSAARARITFAVPQDLWGEGSGTHQT